MADEAAITKRRRHRRSRGEGEDGAALVEFALVSILLCVLLFGIINFGLILSFKQDMTRAAAEGARAGAVAVAGQSEADAAIATDEAVREFGDRFTDGCATDGMKTADGSSGCDVRIHNCDGVTYDPDDAIPDCVTVELRYDYQSHPLLPDIPLMSAFLPDEIKASSVVRINE